MISVRMARQQDLDVNLDPPAFIKIAVMTTLIILHAIGFAALGLKRPQIDPDSVIDINIEAPPTPVLEENPSPLPELPAATPEEQPPEDVPVEPQILPEPLPTKVEPAIDVERERQKRVEAQKRKAEAEQRRRDAEAALSRARATYAGMVASKINAGKFYPTEARKDGISGVVSVAFSIGADGRAFNYKIAGSSGAAILDDAAIAIFKSLEVPPPPGNLFSGTINIRYTMQKS
jgi:protein TonB